MEVGFSEEQAEALRRCAEAEGRSVQQVMSAAIDDYLARHSDDEETDRLAEKGARRWKALLDRLAE
ncbi:CopG family transcriptional regulator [Streptosporangium sp. NBC_01639]|uniref:CopG family transcriptional regulator n=1 Tax=Streptosporangium sp. NBC_01639 TaxID=2975948 RepID=UPI0038685710|nr:CopG family transcriptional regulator [Streptosporangium sp. NBC_01639]